MSVLLKTWSPTADLCLGGVLPSCSHMPTTGIYTKETDYLY